MVIVYFESNSHAEVAAVFPNEETYNAHADALDKQAQDARMIVTTSVHEEVDLDVLMRSTLRETQPSQLDRELYAFDTERNVLLRNMIQAIHNPHSEEREITVAFLKDAIAQSEAWDFDVMDRIDNCKFLKQV